MITDWTDQNTANFRKTSFTVPHALEKTGLFTDEALAALLDKHPRSHLDICTLGAHDTFQYKFRTGEASDVDGKTLIAAAKSGAIWMNVRECMNMHPEYRSILKNMYSTLAGLTGTRQFKPRGAILITSPTAQTPYHCDPTETILWHVRGEKVMHVYPMGQEFLPDAAYERVLYCDNEDYLPYRAKMDEAMTTYELTGGEMVTWPLNAPHRVENRSYCVSVTAEYSSFASSYKNAAMYSNAVLRQKFGRAPLWETASLPERVIKSGAGHILRKLGVLSTLKQADFVSFKVDAKAPNFIRDIDPYLRA